jgi:hypothetical protein
MKSLTPLVLLSAYFALLFFAVSVWSRIKRSKKKALKDAQRPLIQAIEHVEAEKRLLVPGR